MQQMAEKAMFSAVSQSCHLVSVTQAESWEAALWLSRSLLLGARVGSPGALSAWSHSGGVWLWSPEGKRWLAEGQRGEVRAQGE